MKKSEKRKILFSLGQFFIFFCLMAFVVTCNFILFLHFIPLKEDDVRVAAKVTFVNVIVLTLIFCVIDSLRRYFTVTRPIQKIQESINQIVKGDFNVSVPYLYGENSMNQFDRISKGLNVMIEELKSVETLRTDFISNVSHELKTPLTVMQNYGMLLQSPELTDENRMEYATAITKQTQKLSDLITNILKLNRLENQKIIAKKEKFDAGELVCECMIGFENAWEEKNLEVETNIQEEVFVNTDRELLSVVLNNLISNAVKFTSPGGKISVSVKTKKSDMKNINAKKDRQDFSLEYGSVAEICIKDFGCGMDAETGKHIFEKFYQGDTSHATQGNGLGLALVKEIIDILSLEISVESTLGKGSTFTVRIPL